MSTDLAISSDRRGAYSPAVARGLSLVALLLAEVALVTLLFNTADLEGSTGWWAWVLRNASELPRLAVAVAAATLLLAVPQLRTVGASLLEAIRGAGFRTAFLVIHLGVYAAFVALSGLVLREEIAASPYPALCTTAWLGLALGTLVSWGFVLLPLTGIIGLLRQAWVTALGGLSIGTLARVGASLTQSLWEPLSQWTLWLSAAILSPIYPGALHSDSVTLELGTPTFSVIIAAPCSGYEGIGLVWMFLIVYLCLFYRQLRFPHCLLLFPIGTAVIWLTNAVRIAALIVLGTEVSPEVALGGFHSQAGWLAFNAVALGIIVVTQRSRLFTRPTSTTEAAAEPTSSTAVYLAPILALLATIMATTAFSGGFDYFYPLRMVAVIAAAAYFWRQYATWSWTWSWPAVGLGFLVFAGWLALEPAPDPARNEVFAAHLSGLPAGLAAGWLVFRALGSVITVPFAEELAFRGYLTRRLIAADFEQVPMGRFSWFSFLASSVGFGALHGRWLAGTLAGMAFALALYRRGRLSDAILAHATANALIAVYVLGTGNWAMWL